MIDGGIARLPDDERDQGGHRDYGQRGDKAPANVARFEPCRDVDAPYLEQGDRGHDRDHAGYAAAQRREITVGARLETGELLQADAEDAIEHREQRDRGETGDCEQRDGP